MDIIGTIRKYGLTGDAATVTTALNSQTVEHRNSDRVTATDLLGKFGVAKVMLWNTKIVAAGGGVAVQALAGAGLDFSHPKTIEAMQTFAAMGVLDQRDVAELLALGVWHTSPWQESGGEGEAQESDVADALIVIAKQDAIAGLNQRLDVAVIAAKNVIATGGNYQDAVDDIARG